MVSTGVSSLTTHDVTRVGRRAAAGDRSRSAAFGEFGMNMMVIACGDTAILVDAGVMFPEPELLGVDLIIPDLRQLRAVPVRRSC